MSDMAHINLTLIQTFYLVARHGSFSGAARELNISYQSAANHVRRLEILVKEKLVETEKGAKKNILTSYGRTLYNLLHPELDIMLDRLTRLVQNQKSSLRIGMPQAIFFFLFPGILRRFRALYPDMEIAAFERDTALAEMIKNGSLDVCLSERHFGDPAVPQRLLGTYRVALVYPANWGPRPKPDEVPTWAVGRRLVTYEPGQTLRNLTLDFLASSGASFQTAISTSGSSSVKRCVEEGLGFSIIPSWCIQPEDTRLATVRLDNLPEINVYFCCALFLQSNPVTSALLEVCRNALIGSVLDPPPQLATGA